MKWQGCKPPATSLCGASKETFAAAARMNYFLIDLWKASSAFFAFSSAILSFSAAAFSLSSAALMALSARPNVSAAFTLAASAAALAACASFNAWSAFISIIFCSACTFWSSPVVAHPPIIRDGRTSIIVIRNMLFFIALHLLSDPSFRSVFLAGKMDRIRSQYHPEKRKEGMVIHFCQVRLRYRLYPDQFSGVSPPLLLHCRHRTGRR